MEIKTILNSFVDLFFPQRCIGCDEVISAQNFLCTNCIDDIPYTHFKLDQNNLIYHRLRSICKVESATSIFFFQKNHLPQKVLHAIKYQNKANLGGLFVDKLNLDVTHFTGIIPMPIHTKRLQERGYNQVLPFAEALSKKYQLPILENCIVRTKHLKTQTKKDREARFLSLNSTFTLNEIPEKGHYLLLDDVLTTGSTLAKCVQLFDNYNDIKISVVTLAYTK